MDRDLRPIQQFQALRNREVLSRRQFLRVAASVGAVGAGAILLGACGSDDGKGSATSTPGIVIDPPPETTRLRLGRGASICFSPMYLAEEFLPAEGFTDVQYLKQASPAAIANSLASGELDISLNFAASAAIGIDAGDPVVLLGGAHVGCWELFGTDRVKSVRDLRGKTVAVSDLASTAADYTFIASALTFVGIDPAKDVNFETHKKDEAIQLLTEGKVDAYLALPPTNQQLRAQNIGHVVINSMEDPPWSQYFCCLVEANSDFFAKNPVATKRALRSILKGADLCAREPERAARFIVDKGYTDNYDYALATMKTLPYNVWREFNPEDTLRFYALRLNEAGIIKSTPDEIIQRGTDWRLLDELKRELAV
jgi:NitT/TauT family transport system substrate-binding protein